MEFLVNFVIFPSANSCLLDGNQHGCDSIHPRLTRLSSGQKKKKKERVSIQKKKSKKHINYTCTDTYKDTHTPRAHYITCKEKHVIPSVFWKEDRF